MGLSKKKRTREEIFNELCEEIRKLNPTIEEIDEYAKLHEKDYGVVSYGKSDFYRPRVHDTWLVKPGGCMLIDLGYIAEVHLMLNKEYAKDFINFVKKRREGSIIPFK